MKDLLKSKLAWTVAILIVLNIISLGALWCSHGCQHHGMGGGHGGRQGHGGDMHKHFMTEKLNLTPEQQAQFDTLRREHFAEVEKNATQIHALKKQLMALIETQPASDSSAQRLAAQIGALESSIELERYRHFQKMYQRCTDEQKTELKKTLEHIMSSSGRKRHGHGGGQASCGDHSGPPEDIR